MKNKKVKQMLFDVVLKGRKAIWHGDESGVFAAKSLEQLNAEFGVEEFPDEYGCVVSSNWKYWWTPCTSEKEFNRKTGKYITKGAPVFNRKGELVECYEKLPLICGVYGGSDDIAQVLTSYS